MPPAQADLHPDTASTFNATQYGQRGSRVSNAKVERGSDSGTNRRDRGERMRVRGQRLEAAAAKNSLSAPQRFVGKQLSNYGKYQKVKGRADTTGRGATVVSNLKVKAVTRFNVTIAIGWTGVLNMVATWFTVLAIMGLAAAAVVEEATILKTTLDTVASTVSYIMGWPQINLWMIGVGFWILQIAVICIMFFGAHLQLRAGGARTTDGTHGELKKMVFITAFIFSILPGACFFPWIYIWLLLVLAYPN
jgi:hypothetical protein